MAKKSKKGRQQKEGINPKSWPNLPPQLIKLIAIQPILMENITSFGGATKSWRAAQPYCHRRPDNKPRIPQLVEIDSTDDKRPKQTHKLDVTLYEKFYYYKDGRYKYSDPWIHFKGHSHGQLVATNGDLSRCYLWEPAKRISMWLPPWDINLPFKFATLSSSPNDSLVTTKSTPPQKHRYPCNVMVVTGISSPAFAFYRWQRWGWEWVRRRQKEWIFENCTLTEPPYASSNKTLMRFTNAIGFEGKLYALSLQGSLVVIEDIDSRFQITATAANRAVPCGVSRQFREYLLECKGEILLVFLISRKSINVVDDVQVFRLDRTELSWLKVESLGDTMLFVEDECCMGFPAASKVGCRRGNCIYFTHTRVDGWWVFDMETACISSTSGPDIEFTKSPMSDEPLK